MAGKLKYAMDVKYLRFSGRRLKQALSHRFNEAGINAQINLSHTEVVTGDERAYQIHLTSFSRYKSGPQWKVRLTIRLDTLMGFDYSPPVPPEMVRRFTESDGAERKVIRMCDVISQIERASLKNLEQIDVFKKHMLNCHDFDKRLMRALDLFNLNIKNVVKEFESDQASKVR